VQAVVVTRSGGPEVLELQDWPDPEPAAGQLLVDVAAAGVNYRDIYEREGTVPWTPPPFVAGIEGAGTVLAVGEDVTGFSPGDRVAWASSPGSYAERAVVDDGECERPQAEGGRCRGAHGLLPLAARVVRRPAGRRTAKCTQSRGNVPRRTVL